MNELINEQLNLLLEEIELIGDNYQRADIRVKLIQALSELTVDTNVESVSGKESFKNDVKKETTKKTDEKKKESKKSNKKDKKEKEEEIAEDAPIVFEPVVESDTAAVSEEEPQPKEVDLEPAVEETVTEPIVIECEDENGQAYTLDITEAWNIVGDEEGSEEMVELAKNLTEYNLLPIYTTLDKLDHNYNKMMLAYYMQQYTLEGINEFIESLTEGLFNDIYEFVNNENLEGLIANIEEAASEE